MADDCDFLAGDDLDAILDMLEADEGVEEEFNIEVENVNTKNGLIVPVFNNKRPKMTSLIMIVASKCFEIPEDKL